MVDLRELDVESLEGGELLEELNRVWAEEVLPNVFDPNTEPTAKRGLVLTISVKPHKSREMAEVEFSVEPKLPRRKGGSTTVFLSYRGGRAMALGADPRQMTLDDEVEAEGDDSAQTVDISSRRQG